MSSFEKFCLVGFILLVSWMPYNLDREDSWLLFFTVIVFGLTFIITPSKK